MTKAVGKSKHRHLSASGWFEDETLERLRVGDCAVWISSQKRYLYPVRFRWGDACCVDERVVAQISGSIASKAVLARVASFLEKNADKIRLPKRTSA